MIYVITGKPRNGKTFFVIRHIPRWIKNGERIFSNVKINVGQGALKKYTEDIVGNLHNPEDLNNPKKQIFYWHNLHEWNHMTNGIILVDEAQRYFNSRNWAQLSEETELKLQQHGKDDLDVWATTQHFTRIDVTLRILVELYFKVKMVMGNPDNYKSWIPKICVAEGYLLEDLEKHDRMSTKEKEENNIDPETSERFWIRKKYYNTYDTREKVGYSTPMPLIHKKRKCETCGYEQITHQ